ncbi:MAG: methyl-accepting chemotaxis protein [Planctomycetes bacterium]|nr:methyl-accepting chemotaxis protein [Planctomycetota bacterium]
MDVAADPQQRRPWFLIRTVATKLALIIALVGATGGVVAMIIVWSAARDARTTARAVGTMQESALQTAGHQAELLHATSRQLAEAVAAAHAAQDGFRRQVTAFKSVLLRGARPDQDKLFRSQMEQAEAAVVQAMARLGRLTSADADLTRLVKKFSEEHGKLGRSYRNALGVLEMGETRQDGLKAADDYMVGREDAPIALLDQLVAVAGTRAETRLAEVVAEGRRTLATEAEAEAERLRLEAAMAASLRSNLALGLAGLLAVVAMTILVMWLVRRGMRPLHATVEVLDAVAGGDYARRVQATGQDEFGHMARSLNRTVDTLASQRQLMQSNAAVLDGSSGTLIASSTRMAELSHSTAERLQAVGEATRQVTDGMVSAAASTEQMSGSIAEITRSASEAAGRARDVVGRAGLAAQEVQALAAMGQRVQAIAVAIGEIADQTALLSLNAAIEAAHAGSAGRGFAVVAGEIRSLSASTAQAVAGIRNEVAEVSRRCSAAVAAFAELAEQVRGIEQGQTSIAAAIEQQSAATRAIATQVAEAAAAAGRISVTLAEVTSASESTRAGAETTAAAANELSVMAGTLHRLVVDQGSSLAGPAHAGPPPPAREHHPHGAAARRI